MAQITLAVPENIQFPSVDKAFRDVVDAFNNNCDDLYATTPAGAAMLAVDNLFTNNSNVYQAAAGATSVIAREGETQAADAIFQVQTALNAALFAVTKTAINVALASIPAAANNAAADAAGVAVGGLYRTNADPSVVCIRSA